MIKIEKYLSIDWGSKRIGLAIGDNEAKIAVSHKVVNNLTQVLNEIKEEEINKIIIGKPFKMQSEKLKVQDEFLIFFNSLKKKTNIPIKTVDERLTSKASDALIGDKKTKASRDIISAMIILQNYFDRKYGSIL